MQRMVSIYTLLRPSHAIAKSTRWYSDRLGRDMGIVVHGHWGPPMILFPTSGGDEGEYERQSLIGAIGELIDAGRVKTFCVNINHGDSFANKRRASAASQLDAAAVRRLHPPRSDPVHPRTTASRPTSAVWTMGASLGAYHAANTLFKYPDVVKRCFALSGVYDMKRFMDGAYDDNFYFNNPVDYLANASDPWMLGHLATCDIHIATGTGPWEQSGESYRLSQILASRGIRIISTTGARSAGTTGRTGSIRCGSISRRWLMASGYGYGQAAMQPSAMSHQPVRARTGPSDTGRCRSPARRRSRRRRRA